MDFRTYHLCTEASESQFAAEFNQLVAFLRKWDQLGLEKYAKVVGTGYFRVLYDFLSAVHRGDWSSMRRQSLNVMKLVPSTVLFGTAIPLASLLDLGQAGFLMLGLKLIQYAYWPFWSWASKNAKSADPEIARRASMVISAIPDQWRAILTSESIEFDRTIDPHPRTLGQITSDQPNNAEYYEKWRRELTHHVFRFPLAQDRFVHFTTRDRATEIIESGVLRGSAVYAISLLWGEWYPGVQFTHILPKDRRGDLGSEVVAVEFRTTQPPLHGRKEEVYWDRSVPLSDARIISHRDAIRMLKHTKYGASVGSEDFVEYY